MKKLMANKKELINILKINLIKFWNWICKSFKKYWLLILLLIIEFLLADFVVFRLVNAPPIAFLRLLIIYTLWIITIYIFSETREIRWLKKHQTFLAILAVILPIMLFFLQNSIETINSFKKYEGFLKEENNRNSSHLESIINDLSNDSGTIFWRDFSTRSYVEFWDYIHWHKSQECKDLYATLTIQLDILNNINRMRQELILIPNELYKNMLNNASSTKPILDSIVNKCQSL
jgi:hypothetical protein